MWPELINMLSWWQWLILAAAPPAIVALYFLKLKRRPVKVPSTYLWRRSIEDLHVNAIWQRLRRNLLLFLQLLLILLAVLALLRPGWKGGRLDGDRFVFLIDNSASMQATDTGVPRLQQAKEEARRAIELMKKGDAAMIVSFADAARVEQVFTSNRRELLRSLDAIGPTPRPTSLAEALRVASGLANPGRSASDAWDQQVAEPLPATLLVFSDGRFDDEAEVSLGNLDPVYRPIGSPEAKNVGIVVFAVRRNEAKPDQFQAFARLQNFGSEEATGSLELAHDGRLIDAAEFRIGPGQTHGFQRDLGPVDSGILQLKVSSGDDLAVDDTAWTVLNPARRARVLVVTSGNEPLRFALETSSAAELAEVTVQTPDVLQDKKNPYYQQAAVGAYDLVIYDRCRPLEMPEANTLFLGALPPAELERPDPLSSLRKDAIWKASAEVDGPQIIDVDPAHPLTQWLDMGDVLIARGTPLAVPSGGSVLIDSHLGPMLVIAPRERFEDAVLGFVLVDEKPGARGAMEEYVGTNWYIRPSFPVFVLNMLQYLGGSRKASDLGAVRPGQPVALESPLPGKTLDVITPAGQTVALTPTDSGRVNFTGTDALGVYAVRLDGKLLEHFAVNLFQPSESDIRPRTEINIGRVPVKGRTAAWDAARRETWKLLLLCGVVVLLVEWYVYNRRVYV